VVPYLGDDHDVVRSAAVRALQSMRDPQVDGILATRLREDGSSDVRISALDAAQVRDPSSVLAEAVASAGTEAADAHVRFRAVELMIRWLPQRPALRSTLESVAKNDAELRVRSRAQAAL
jgi:HEAT repeat protein